MPAAARRAATAAATVKAARPATVAAVVRAVRGSTSGTADRARSAATEWGDKAAAASRRAEQLRTEGNTTEADRFDELAKIAIRRQISYEGQASTLETQAARVRPAAALVGGLPEFNEDRFDLGSAGCDPAQVIGAARTLPVMSERRFVRVRGLGEKRAARLVEELLPAYLEDPSPTTVLVLEAEQVDKRLRWVKQVAKLGGLIECAGPKGPAETRAWIEQALRERGKRAAPGAAAALAELVGGDTDQLRQEIEKLCLYLGDESVADAEDVSAVTGQAWPLFAPTVGAMGAFVAGSNTISNMMFSLFQFSTAEQIGLGAAGAAIVVAAQAIGGAAGNMICVHNVVAASATVGLVDREGEIIRKTLVPTGYYVVQGGLIASALIAGGFNAWWIAAIVWAAGVLTVMSLNRGRPVAAVAPTAR